MVLFPLSVLWLFVWYNIKYSLLLPDPHISSIFILWTLGSVGGEQDESYGLSASPRKRHTAGPKSDRTRCPLLSTRLLRDFMSYVLLLAFVREQRPERCDRYRSIEEGRHLLKYIQVLLKSVELWEQRRCALPAHCPIGLYRAFYYSPQAARVIGAQLLQTNILAGHAMEMAA